MSNEHILVRLRHLTSEKPTTKMGQVRWALQEIEAALAAGHTLQVVHARLKDVGIEIGYRTLSLYLGRLKRRQKGRDLSEQSAPRHWEKDAPAIQVQPARPLASPASMTKDPFSNIRSEREKKQKNGFDYDAFSTNKHLLE